MFLLWWRLTSHLWCLDFERDFFFKILFLWSIELFWINYAWLVMYLNSCSMDLGRDSLDFIFIETLSLILCRFGPHLGGKISAR